MLRLPERAVLEKLKSLLRPLGVVGALFALGSTAQAMCVYNDMEVSFRVFFDCGVFCKNDWTVQPNDYTCRANHGGTLYGGDVRTSSSNTSATVSVEVLEHGYIVFYTLSGAQRRACAYRSDDSLDYCEPFTWPQ